MVLKKLITDASYDYAGVILSPTKSLAVIGGMTGEYLRKMYPAGWYYYPTYDGKTYDKGKRYRVAIAPHPHVEASKDGIERLKGLRPSEFTWANIARDMNREQHPNLRRLLDTQIPTDPFRYGTVTTRYLPNYKLDEWRNSSDYNASDEGGDFDETSSKTNYMVTISNPVELMVVASKEAEFRSGRSLTEETDRGFQMELTGLTIEEIFESSRLKKMLSAIAVKDESMIARIEAQVVYEG